MTSKAHTSPKTKENRPSGTIVKVKNPRKHEYEMVRSVKYDGVLYKQGEKVRLTGRLLKLFISNNYIYG